MNIKEAIIGLPELMAWEGFFRTIFGLRDYSMLDTFPERKIGCGHDTYMWLLSCFYVRGCLITYKAGPGPWTHRSVYAEDYLLIHYLLKNK